MDSTTSFPNISTIQVSSENITEQNSSENITEQNSSDENIAATVYSIIGCIGVIDNGFVLAIMVLYKPLTTRLNNLYIINQSVIDLLSSVLLLVTLPDRFYSVDFFGISGELYCRLWRNKLFLWGCLLSSTYNTVAISVDRYIAVVNPLWYKTSMTKGKVYIGIGLAWVVGMCFYLPLGVGTSGVMDAKCVQWGIFPDKTTLGVVSTIDLLITFPVPVFIMIVAYTRMIVVIKYQNNKVHVHTETTQVSHNISTISEATTSYPEVEEPQSCQHPVLMEPASQGNVQPQNSQMLNKIQRDHNTMKMNRIRMNIFTTMAAVSLCFILCWIWNTVWSIVNKMVQPLSRSSPFYHFSVYAVQANSVLNPLIYLTRYDQFKQGVRAVILRRKTNVNSIQTIRVRGQNILVK